MCILDYRVTLKFQYVTCTWNGSDLMIVHSIIIHLLSSIEMNFSSSLADLKNIDIVLGSHCFNLQIYYNCFQMSHYLDIVEVQIAQQISRRSEAFFHAMTSHDELQDKMKVTCGKIKFLRYW